ncbi:MAG: glycosyltransferase, partial [Alphaproteobacteria bacterium]
DLPGSKVVVGDGPQLGELKRAYGDVHFTGAQRGEALAEHYASADVFVFPSRTDTFGLVLLEALASGLPVAAYPVAGPLDVINGSDVGVLKEDLGTAAREALQISPARCRDYALRFSWRACAEQFLASVQPIR